MNGETQKVILSIIEDGLIYLLNRIKKKEEKEMLEKLTLFYFNLTGEKEAVTYEQLLLKEKRVFFNIIIEGITDIILKNEYINMIYLTKDEKKEIVNEAISFISEISNIDSNKIKRKIMLKIRNKK